MGKMTQILNQLVDHQHGVPIHSATAKSPNELPSWGSPRVTHTNPTLPSSIVSLSLLGNHEEDSRTGLSGRGAAVGIGNVFSSYSLGLGARPKFADIQNGYQAAAFLFSDPQFLVFFFFTLALLLLYFWGTVQQREAARESILSKNTELGAAHKFSYGWAGVSLEPVFGSCTCNETPIKKRGEGRTESE